MLKLYKKISGNLHYWETWDKNTITAIIHWGVVGEKGESKEMKSSLFSNFRKKVQQETNEKISEGFNEIPEEELKRLVIEYKIENHGTDKDIDKRHRLENKLNEILGWRGLGHCDGGSMGSGTMEVFCFVISFDIAKKVMEAELKHTDFSDYLKISDENMGI